MKSSDVLNSLLRDEIAAVETYKRAFTSVPWIENAGLKTLRNIEYDHEAANGELRTKITGCGGLPVKSSDAWEAFAASTSASLDIAAALSALKQGEEKGVKNYELALAYLELIPECRQMIRDRLLPQSRTHVKLLDVLISKC